MTIRMLLILSMVLLVGLVTADTTAGQAHTPAPAVVNGNEVTIDGSFCWHDATIASTIGQGQTLTLPGIFANVGGREPIILKMPPGTHKITVLGFPDDGGNLRRAVEQQVVVGQPTRQDRLVAAYKLVEEGKNLWRLANEQISALKPTRAEVIAALQAIAAGS